MKHSDALSPSRMPATRLPSGWLEIELGEHVYIAGRIGWRGLKADEYTVHGPIFLSVPNLNHGDEVNFTRVNHISQARYDESPEIKLEQGDTLLVKDGAGIGKIGFVANLPGPATVNSSLLIVRPANDLICKKYLFYYLKGPKFQEIALERITGSTTPHLFQKDIKRLRVLVPPLPEQRRIVAKLEKLLAKIDACQQRLEKIPLLLKRFRQSVLAAACSGRLTTDWREENPNVESTQILMDDINEVRRKQAKPEKVELMPDDECPDDSIPATWVWVHFGTVIGELRNGVPLRPNIDPPGTPILRISAARPGAVNLEDFRYLPNAEQFVPQFTLRNDDLIFTRYNGSIEFLGTCGMVKGLRERIVLYPDKLMRVRFDHASVIPAYAEVFFQAPQVHERVVAKAKSSAGQNGISGSDIKEQPFALPPLPEQHEIVRRVEQLFILADQIEARFTQARAQIEKLTPSLLARAFRGELVPQDSNDERAEELLRRIHHAGEERSKKLPA